MNIGVVTIFRLAKTSLLQVYWMDKCLLQNIVWCYSGCRGWFFVAKLRLWKNLSLRRLKSQLRSEKKTSVTQGIAWRLVNPFLCRATCARSCALTCKPYCCDKKNRRDARWCVYLKYHSNAIEKHGYTTRAMNKITFRVFLNLVPRTFTLAFEQGREKALFFPPPRPKPG